MNNFLVIKVAIVIAAMLVVYAVSSYSGAANPVQKDVAPGLLVAPHDPFSPVQILPASPLSDLQKDSALMITGARGSIEPASFVLRPSRGIQNIQIRVSNLTNPRGLLIPSRAVDIRLVKCWFQAARNSIRRSAERVLVPELLVKDDSLVAVDYTNKRNYLRVNRNGKEEYIDISIDDGGEFPAGIVFNDAATLQPFDLGANENRQVWLTIQIPSNAVEGVYRGKITVFSGRTVLNALPFTVRVLPFSLREPVLEYAMYYRGILTAQKYPAVGSELKSSWQYQHELEDMVQHGITSPTIFQRYDDSLLSQALRVRNNIALSRERLYTLGTTTANPTDDKSLSELAGRVRLWKSLAATYKYRSVFIYGIDEATGEKLTAQRRSWDVVHREGAGMFVALYEGAVERAGDHIDVAVLSGYKPAEVAKWRQRGKRVLCYGNPQVVVEDPSVYRRNYGLMLWIGGYHGCMPYAYQHGFGNIWNDFDHKEFRDHVFAYPTSNGLIGTVQWEGFRCAVDDVRYLSTLLALEGPDNGGIRKTIGSMLADNATPPNQIRSWITGRILERLQSASTAAR